MSLLSTDWSQVDKRYKAALMACLSLRLESSILFDSLEVVQLHIESECGLAIHRSVPESRVGSHVWLPLTAVSELTECGVRFWA